LGDFEFEMKFVKSNQIEATANEVCEHFADTGAKLTVKMLEKNDVLIEGDSNSLEFLANYILAYLNGDEHARNINPKSAGKIFFTSKSTKGLYIHVLPCRHGNLEK
jgi:hypothetical protein